MNARPLQSIRWRLQLWQGLLLLAALLGLWLSALYLALDRRRLQVDERLGHAMGGLMPSVNARPAAEQAPRDLRLPGGVRAQFGAPEEGLCYYLVWQADGRVLARSEHAPTAAPDVGAIPVATAGDVGPQEMTRDVGPRRERIRRTVQGLYVLVGADLARETATAFRETARLGLAVAIVLGLNLAVGWWLVGRALRPLDDIARAADKIADGDLSERIDTRDTASELGALAQVLNRTFSRLQEAFARQARFTADASHELRTPVTVILAEARGTLSRPRSAEEYREALGVCAETAAGMGKLIEALLQLARFDSGENLPQRQRTALAPLILSALEPLHSAAAQHAVQLATDLTEVEASVDPDLVRQAVVNLVANALDHTPAGGSVRVELRADDEAIHLRVIDSGCGIPPEHLPHIFDRFHRVDEVRNDQHLGIGLSIVKAIVDAHGGSIAAESEVGRGTTMHLRFPAAESAASDDPASSRQPAQVADLVGP